MELTKAVARAWKSASDEEKKPYHAMCAAQDPSKLLNKKRHAEKIQMKKTIAMLVLHGHEWDVRSQVVVQ